MKKTVSLVLLLLSILLIIGCNGDNTDPGSVTPPNWTIGIWRAEESNQLFYQFEFKKNDIIFYIKDENNQSHFVRFEDMILASNGGRFLYFVSKRKQNIYSL